MRAKIRKSLTLVIAAACVAATLPRSVEARPAPARARVARKSEARGGRTRPVVYLAVGDSTGVGVGAQHGGYVARLFARIERARPGSRLVNLCASALATSDVLERLDRAPEGESARGATLVTVGVGANDLIRGVEADTFARNYEEMVVRLKERATGTRARILVMNIPDLSLAPAVPAYLRESARRHVEAFNRRISEIARRHGLVVFDLYARSREFAARPEFFSRDGVHPSDAGYDFWARLVWPEVEKLINPHRGRPPKKN